MWFRRIFGADARPAGPDPAGRKASGSGPAGLALSAQAVRQLNRLHLNTHRSLPSAAAGSRSSHRRRPSSDFREHRMYTPGDDVRFVDWKASARQEHIFIKQGDHLKDAPVYVLVDCSASMAWGDPPKSQAALSLAAALSYMALAHGDRLTVVPLSRRQPRSRGVLPLGPVTGKGQFPALLNYLRAIQFQGQVDLDATLAGFSKPAYLKGGLVLILSDLLGLQDMGSVMHSLPMPTWNVVVFHLLHPAEIDPQLHGDLELQDIETGQKKKYSLTDKALETYRQRLQAWQEGVESACLERKALYTLIPTDWSLESQTIPHLRAINVVKSL